MIELLMLASMTCNKTGQLGLSVQWKHLYIREAVVIFMKDKVVSCRNQKYSEFCTVQTDKESLEVAESCGKIQKDINQLK